MKKILIFVGIILALIFAVVILPDINRENISDTLLRYPGIDKPIHFIEFTFILCFAYFILSLRIFNVSKKKRVLIAILISFCVSVIDEFHQLFVSERSFEYADLLANTLGILTGITIIYSRKIPAAITTSILAAVLVIVSLITFDSYKKTRHFNRGILYERGKNFGEAMKHYLLALESGNESSSLYNNMAWINIEFLNGDPEVSLAYAKKALSMNPESADIIETYGWILYKMNEPAEAISYLKKALEMDPEIYCVQYHLGAAYYALGEYETSLYHLNKQIEMNLTNRYAEKSREIIEKIKSDASLIKSGRTNLPGHLFSSTAFTYICSA